MLIFRRHWFGAKAPKEISPRLANIDLLICHKFVKDHLAQCEAEVLEARFILLQNFTLLRQNFKDEFIKFALYMTNNICCFNF